MKDTTPHDPGPAPAPGAGFDARRLDPAQLDLAVGGQAVIEGVMMRSPTAVATAVRALDGRIVVRKRPYRSVARRFSPLRLPVLRGGVQLIESIGLGIGALMFAADQSTAEETVEPGRTSAGRTLLMWGSVLLAFALGLGLFFYLPLLLTDLMGIRHSVLFNVVDGVLRVGLFVLYLWGVSKLPDMARVFQYHGAEHKSIHAFENRRELTVAQTRPFTTLHPRCGTSFLFFVMMISIVVFVFLGRPETIGARLLRLAFVPLIGGIAYEAIKLSGRHKDSAWLRPLIWPGLMLQHITTSEPDDGQLEVGLAALQAVLAPEAEGFAERIWSEGPSPAGPAGETPERETAGRVAGTSGGGL